LPLRVGLAGKLPKEFYAAAKVSENMCLKRLEVGSLKPKNILKK
jgi:hypothetical protein